MHAIAERLRDSGLKISESPGGLLISNPEAPDKGRVRVDVEIPGDPYISWERVEYDSWGINDPESAEDAEFVTSQVLELLS